MTDGIKANPVPSCLSCTLWTRSNSVLTWGACACTDPRCMLESEDEKTLFRTRQDWSCKGYVPRIRPC